MSSKMPKISLPIHFPNQPGAPEEVKSRVLRRRPAQFQRIINAIYSSPQVCSC